MCRYKRLLIQTFGLEIWPLKKPLQIALQDILRINVDFLSDMPVPASAYNHKRSQFLAEKFLEILVLKKTFDSDMVLGIVDVDLYEPGLNFVFGLASYEIGVGIISLKRLSNTFYGLENNEELYFKRVLTEAVHEIGHILGLPHCPDVKCVMHFSNSIADTDRKSYHFCKNCQEKASKVLCMDDFI
ncbi:archaemetzincin family Zn-dependent metalloprotease [Nitrosophilus alvini]|uniref:archaemetzincin family Zn-dependent metalloprotease n=1 Tax=Nitrosophilus alvini TaxID=2714855 RepID=UPI00190E41F8|nr:archaemetzincin family Zn-dependent metalloprotease [Nitrosophilus alvini]